jgi:prevent-host-death family protein
MNIISISDLRKNLYNIVKRVVESHEPVIIVNRNSEDAAVLISQRDWEDIQKTLYLQSNKDARETIVSALGRPIEEGEGINWRNGE